MSSNGTGYIQNLRALCRLKWVPKVNDADTMLVQCYPAIKHMVLSLLDKQKAEPDYQGAAIKSASAMKALDDQLNVELNGQEPEITVRNVGLPRGGSHRGRNRRAYAYR